MPSRGLFGESDVIILDGSTGLLGSGHPLYIKSALQSAIKAQTFSEETSRAKTIKTIESFLSKTLDQKVYLTNPTSTYDPKDIRLPEFLTTNSLNSFKKGEVVNLFGLFPEVIGIKNSPDNENDFWGLQNEFSMKLSESITRFLDLGQFYGTKGLIRNREEQLKNAFQNLKHYKSTHGLTVEFDKDLANDGIKTYKETLIFPTSFDLDQLNHVKDFLEAKCLS